MPDIPAPAPARRKATRGPAAPVRDPLIRPFAEWTAAHQAEMKAFASPNCDRRFNVKRINQILDAELKASVEARAATTVKTPKPARRQVDKPT